MSSRQLEERQEREQHEWVASKLRVPADDLAEHDYEIVENSGNDGAVYGYRVEFRDASDPDLLALIPAAKGGWIDIGFAPEGPDEL